LRLSFRDRVVDTRLVDVDVDLALCVCSCGVANRRAAFLLSAYHCLHLSPSSSQPHTSTASTTQSELPNSKQNGIPEPRPDKKPRTIPPTARPAHPLPSLSNRQPKPKRPASIMVTPPNSTTTSKCEILTEAGPRSNPKQASSQITSSASLSTSPITKTSSPRSSPTPAPRTPAARRPRRLSNSFARNSIRGLKTGYRAVGGRGRLRLRTGVR
jgi:hypothetical protein